MERTCQGHKITFNPDGMNFIVSGPEFEQYKLPYCTFDSFKEAQQAIEKEITTASKIAAAGVQPLSITVLDERGNTVRLSTINRTTGILVGTEGSYVYPNVPWVAESLREVIKLRLKLKTLNDSLQEVQISTKCGFGRIEAAEYPKCMKEVENRVATQTRKAEEVPHVS